MTIIVYVRKYDSAPFTVLDDDAVNEQWDDTLNALHEWPTIAGLPFAPSDILRELDPIAYRTYRNDWVDEEYEQLDIPEDIEWDSDEFHEWIDRAINGGE